MRRLGVFVGTVAGCGYFPVAPGTVGSAAGVVIYALTRGWSSSAQVGLVVAITLVGVWAATHTARYLNREDPGPVVIDEVAGQLVTLLLLDVGVAGMFAGFLLFRVLDIVKPWPARQLEALPEGVGIMADDLMAGVYGWILLRGLLWAVPLAW